MKRSILPLLLSLSACSMAPAHADAWTPGASPVMPPAQHSHKHVKVDLLKPLPTALQPRHIDAEGTRYSDEDLRLGFLPVPRGFRRFGGGIAFDYAASFSPRGGSGNNGNNNDGNLQAGGNGNGNNGCGNGNGGPNGGKDCGDGPKPPAVPGPLPILGVGAAFIAARKLRQRIG